MLSSVKQPKVLSGQMDRELTLNHEVKGAISINVRELQSRETSEIVAGGVGTIERYQPD